MCMGVFQPYHCLEYEPSLADGKVPDFKITLPSGRLVYVECKSQSFVDTERQRSFSRAADRINRTLNLKTSKFVVAAWGNGLRTEVRLSETPNDHDLIEFESGLDDYTPTAGMPPLAFGKSISLALVSREQTFDKAHASPIAIMEVGTTPMPIDYTNAYAAIYP